MTAEVDLAAMLVAAGPSSRLGQPKQLVEFAGETLVRRAARLLCEWTAHPLLAVTGHEHDRVAEQLEGLDVTCSFNPEWQLGMGGSIALGAGRLPERVGGILVGVCDQWLLGHDDLARLVGSWRTAPKRIHLASWQADAGAVSGPPVIFPGHLRGELEGLDKRRGARPIIDRHFDLVEWVHLPAAAHDLDGPDDLALLQSQTQSD